MQEKKAAEKTIKIENILMKLTEMKDTLEDMTFGKFIINS